MNKTLTLLFLIIEWNSVINKFNYVSTYTNKVIRQYSFERKNVIDINNKLFDLLCNFASIKTTYLKCLNKIANIFCSFLIKMLS